MKHKLACADFAFPLLSHDDSLRLISMLGFQGVDIGLFEGRSHLWPAREFENVRESSTRLRQKTADLGVRVADVFLQTDSDFRAYPVNHPDPVRRRRARDWFQRTLDYAAGCECPHVTILPGVRFDDEPADASFARACDELGWRVDRSTEYGIVLGAEAHIGSLVPDPLSAQDLVQSVPGLTLTLDYTHFIRAGLTDGDVEPLLAHASHFHVRGACPGRLQASFKDNVIDYRRIARRMDEFGYRGWIGIEYVWTEWERCNECDNLCETILFRDFLLSLPD